MKTTNVKSKTKRSLVRTLLLMFGIFAISVFTVNTASAQNLKDKLSKTENILENYEAENIDTSYTFKFNEELDKYEIYNRELKFFDSNNLLYAQINQRHIDDSKWENYDRTIKSFDEEGKVIENLHQKWNAKLGKWVNLKIKTMTYNDQGEKTEILYHEWRQALDRWISTVRYLISYNRNGEESSVIIKTYSPASDSWDFHLRYTFEYDHTMGKPYETFVEKYDPYTNSWENRGKYLMNYDFRGNTTNEIHVNWNQSMNQWVKSIKYERDFKKDLLQNEVLLRWDFQEKEWNNAIKSIFNYDESGELVSSTEKQWNKDSAAWIVKNKYLYSDIKDIPKK